MGSHRRRTYLPLVLIALLLGSAAAAAQSGAPSPDRLWRFGSTGDATFNDVAIDANGHIMAAVQSDAAAQNLGDAEVFAWDLEQVPNSSEPALSDDPNEPSALNPTAGEGLGVVALEPAKDGKAQFMAVGRESSNEQRIYIYNIRRGPETSNQVDYPDASAPSGALQEMWFLPGQAKLVAYHAGGLSLIRQQSGTDFNQISAWTPPGDQSLQDVTISEDGSRILVAATAGVQNPTIHLYILEEKGGELTRVSNPETRDRNSADAVVDLDRKGEYAVLGTGDQALFYYAIEEDATPDAKDPNATREWNFSAAWSFRGPGGVTAVELAGNGTRFAAGFADASLLVFRQTELLEDGPLAARAVKSAFQTAANPSELTFASDGRNLFAVAGDLYAFHQRQLDPNKALEPIWSLPNIADVAVSSNARRMLVLDASGGNVRAYEQAYRANLTIEAPDVLTPGEKTSIQVQVNNTGSAFDSYRLDVPDAPSAWSISFNRSELPLLPGQGAEVTLNVTPDASQPPANLTFTVRAKSTAAPRPQTAGKASVTVRIPVVRAAEISVDQDTIKADRGQEARIDAQLTNAGNTNTSLRVEVDQERSWTVQIGGSTGESRTFTLDPGTTRSLAIRLAVPQDVAKGTRNEVTLRAAPVGTGSSDKASVSVLIEPAYGATLTGPTETLDAQPGQTLTFEVTLRNTGNTPDTYQLTASSNATNPDHLWRTSLQPSKVTLQPETSQNITVTVNVPRGAETGEAADVTISVRSSTTGEQVDSATFRLKVPEEENGSPLGILVGALSLGAAALVRRRTR